MLIIHSLRQYLLKRLNGLILFTCLAMVATSVNAKATPSLEGQSVLVSVHPMALLIKSAWPELEVSSLVSANQSPHDFVLKPSDMSNIAAADAVIWMGETFEPYLAKALRGQRQVDLSVTLDEADAHANDGQAGDEHENDEHADHHDHDAHIHDPHLWLDPNGIKKILSFVQSSLALPAPKAFIAQYDAWLSSAATTLIPHKDVGFVSFHDAFHAWVETFKLNQVAVVTSNPEKPVGTRHIVEVRNILASGQVQCLFVEPQFQSRIVTKLHKGLSIKVIKIDPMASKFLIDEAGFINFYQSLLGSFTQCFSGPQD